MSSALSSRVEGGFKGLAVLQSCVFDGRGTGNETLIALGFEFVPQSHLTHVLAALSAAVAGVAHSAVDGWISSMIMVLQQAASLP